MQEGTRPAGAAGRSCAPDSKLLAVDAIRGSTAAQNAERKKVKASALRRRWAHVRFDARTGMLIEDVQPVGKRRWNFMNVMLSLHRDLFAGLAGELFLGVMGLLLVVAVVSGVVLYGPFTKHLAFGTMRATGVRRIEWRDLHNLLGISTLAWVLVVGAKTCSTVLRRMVIASGF
jgi:uncharacterized iron-regulated membrane protein